MTDADRYAVIGHPITHSKSPIIHQLFADSSGDYIQYEAIDVPPEKLGDFIRNFAAKGGRGLNVTVPHKRNVIEFLDSLTERAEQAGAVNTIICEPDGRLRGDNTDGVGLVTDLRDNLKVELTNSRILVLGAGGATRGIIPALLEQKPAELVISNRTIAKAQELAAQFTEAGDLTACGFAYLNRRTFNLIINATSAGLSGELPPFPASLLESNPVIYDLSYSMSDTPFISWAKEHGCERTYQGWGMLVEQAAESFAIWRGKRPNTATVRRQLP
jgi:shikimate dehydrogenase